MKEVITFSCTESVISVINIFVSNKSNMNLFDVRYQLRLNDLYDFSSTSIINYEFIKTFRLLDHFSSEKLVDLATRQ